MQPFYDDLYRLLVWIAAGITTACLITLFEIFMLKGEI